MSFQCMRTAINTVMVFLPGYFLRASFDRFRQSLSVAFPTRDSPRCHGVSCYNCRFGGWIARRPHHVVRSRGLASGR
eukprot:75531-Pyramimonas_sp.AAC.1